MIDVPESRLADFRSWTLPAEPVSTTGVNRLLPKITHESNGVAFDIGAVAVGSRRIVDFHPQKFVVLGKTYLLTAETALSAIPEPTTAIAFASNETREYIGDCEWLPSTETERERLGTTLMELKGKQLLTLAKNVDGEKQLRRLRNVSDEAQRMSTEIQ